MSVVKACPASLYPSFGPKLAPSARIAHISDIEYACKFEFDNLPFELNSRSLRPNLDYWFFRRSNIHASVGRKEQRSELRLVSQPLLRYEPADKRIVDGALFSFSLGTDPEVLLLLEARPEKDRPEKDRVWQYAFARFHFVDLTAFHKDQEVWHVDLIPGIQGVSIGSADFQDSTYAIYRVK